MSMPMGMVMVFEEGVVPREKQEQVVARATGLQTPLERYVHSQDIEVMDTGRWLSSGVMIMSRNPMGCELLKLTWSPNALACEPDSVIDRRMESIERVAIACLDELGTRFGYLTHYSNQLEEAWIEAEVLMPLLCEDWEDLVRLPFHFVTHTSDIPLRCPETATVIYTSKTGRIVRLGKHRSPFGF